MLDKNDRMKRKLFILFKILFKKCPDGFLTHDLRMDACTLPTAPL
jgi:hypothetical protein